MPYRKLSQGYRLGRVGIEQDEQAVAEAKAWMRGLLEQTGWSKTALADYLGVEPKTVFNAFSDSKPSLPRGVHFYRLLKELGGLAETDDNVVPSLPETINRLVSLVERLNGRLESREDETRASRQAISESLASVAAGMDALQAAMLRIEARLEESAAPPRASKNHG